MCAQNSDKKSSGLACHVSSRQLPNLKGWTSHTPNSSFVPKRRIPCIIHPMIRQANESDYCKLPTNAYIEVSADGNFVMCRSPVMLVPCGAAQNMWNHVGTMWYHVEPTE
ncbi:hypothetical protein TNCT_624351 [Trichonephila clavata]|uniref:Uncharacterized protein n=1 Tax=Trichonephila clavata TaxID=2740835 RepID=A0A8X6IWV9_TRICU|nr:hypothetical protein TNCT_624351 [Trichonephila clavata]